MLWGRSVFSFIVLFASVPIFANEGPAPKAEGAAAVEPTYSGKQTQDWSDVQTKLSALKGKVDAQDTVVKSLILEKSTLSGESQAAKIEQLKKEHQKWQNLVNDYNKLNSEYETRFPEKGLKESRIYKRIDPKSIERIENDMTVDGRLRRLQRKVFKQYPNSSREIEEAKLQKLKVEEQKKIQRRNLNQPMKNLDEKPKTNTGDITDQIILQK